MERGYININLKESKVEVQLINNNLWLSKLEMARLLNCFPQKIEADLRSIFKNNLLWENECTFNRRYMDKGIEKQCLYYNMETLIFISYRVNTSEAKIFRDFVHSALCEHLQKEKRPTKSMKVIWLYRPQQWN
jgi:hypothetical protein